MFYLKLSLQAFYIMSIWSFGNMYLVYQLKDEILIISIYVFLIGWVLQFIEHLIEGKKLSFFEDVKFLWIGPLFVIDCIFLKFGLKL